MNNSFIKQQKILRYPRLDSVLMVENHIKTNDGTYRKKKLWESLPKKMMYQTFSIIIDYLYYSRKISIDQEQKIGWIHYPEIANKFINNTTLSRKQNESNNKISQRKNKTIILPTRKRQS